MEQVSLEETVYETNRKDFVKKLCGDGCYKIKSLLESQVTEEDFDELAEDMILNVNDGARLKPLTIAFEKDEQPSDCIVRREIEQSMTEIVQYHIEKVWGTPPSVVSNVLRDMDLQIHGGWDSNSGIITYDVLVTISGLFSDDIAAYIVPVAPSRPRSMAETEESLEELEQKVSELSVEQPLLDNQQEGHTEQDETCQEEDTSQHTPDSHPVASPDASESIADPEP